MKIKIAAAVIGAGAIVTLGALSAGIAGASGSGDSNTFGYVTAQPSVPAMSIGEAATAVAFTSVEPTAPTTLGIPSASPTVKAGG